jgi:hypothetical protein
VPNTLALPHNTLDVFVKKGDFQLLIAYQVRIDIIHRDNGDQPAIVSYSWELANAARLHDGSHSIEAIGRPTNDHLRRHDLANGKMGNRFIGKGDTPYDILLSNDPTDGAIAAQHDKTTDAMLSHFSDRI